MEVRVMKLFLKKVGGRYDVMSIDENGKFSPMAVGGKPVMGFLSKSGNGNITIAVTDPREQRYTELASVVGSLTAFAPKPVEAKAL
jgi:hypothetical protein